MVRTSATGSASTFSSSACSGDSHLPRNAQLVRSASARADAGLANVDTTRQRTDGDVVRANVLTFFNVVLGVLILALLAVGEFRDGLFVAVGNGPFGPAVLSSTTTEFWAQQTAGFNDFLTELTFGRRRFVAGGRQGCPRTDDRFSGCTFQTGRTQMDARRAYSA